MILTKDFFDRPVLKVCPELLGKYLVIDKNGVEQALMITEIEAYDGTEDLACHARHGKKKRNEIMFGEPGKWYTYMIYGMYWMLNIVTGPGNHPSAILIRGVEGSNGPGKLTKKLGIDKNFNGKDAKKDNGLWIEDRGEHGKSIITDKRIGIDYAGDWKDMQRRFILK